MQSLALDATQGRTPWNKGKKMSSAHKQKISNAQKKRWRESPMLRDTMVPKLKASSFLKEEVVICNHKCIVQSA